GRADIFIRFFDLYDGISPVGIAPIDVQTSVGDARIENCRIRYNFALAPDTEIVRLASYYGGDVYFLDNIVAENTARYSSQLMLLSSWSHAFVNNNTVTANLYGTSADSVDGLIATFHGQFANNIVWNNTAHYPEIWADSAAVFVDNDIDLIGAAMDPS